MLIIIDKFERYATFDGHRIVSLLTKEWSIYSPAFGLNDWI